MNTAALIIIVLASLSSNTSGKPVKLSEGERNAVVVAVGSRTCSEGNGACVANVILDGKKAYGAFKKAEKSNRE